MQGDRSMSRRCTAFANAMAAGGWLVLLKLVVGIAILVAVWPSLRPMLAGA